jgi:hypothetical protein
MPFLVIPHEVTVNTARLWIGIADENFNSATSVIALEYGEEEKKLGPADWLDWSSKAGTHNLKYARITLDQLEARKTYPLRLRVNGKILADGKITTLPDRLPSLDETGFTVLLGSCFSVRRQESGAVGSAFFNLPSGRQPDVKFLCGDQVYLDDPTDHYTAHTHSFNELETEFFENYLRAWSQGGSGWGFLEVLKNGANYFSPDDHEFWNNAPNRAPLIRDTWLLSDHRTDWRRAALGLFRIFQSESALTNFTVGNLSFLITDTRTSRDVDRKNFMTPGDMVSVGQWVRSLTGPGVLVVGQPIFSKTADFFGEFTDWGLPDYQQYGELVRHLASSDHTIIILTGDVHFSRVASCPLKPGVELIEIISSPMTLVNDLVGKQWHEAPNFFPASNLPGAVSSRIPLVTKDDWKQFDNHFLTIEFFGIGTSVKMRVWNWLVGGGGTSSSTMIYENTLR